MARLTNDNLHGLPSVAPAFTVGNSSMGNSEDGGTFDLLFKQVTTTVDRPAEDVSQADRTESDTRPAEEPTGAAESNEDGARPGESQPSDEAPSELADPPEQGEQEQGSEQGREQSQEQDQDEGQGQEEKEKTDADGGEGSETSETDPDQPIEGEEDAQVQAENGSQQVLAEAVAQQVEAGEANVGKASAEEEPLQTDRDNQAASKAERRAGTAAKVEVSAEASGESNGEQGESAKEKDAPVVELTGDDAEEAATKRSKNAGEKNVRQETAAIETQQNSNPTETSGVESAASAVKAPQTGEKSSRRERRQAADQIAATETASEANPVAKVQVAPNAAAEILAAVTDPAKSAADDGAAEAVESGPKPVAGVVNQAESGQQARGSSDQGPRAVSGGEAASSSEGDPIDRVRFVQRVARAFDAASSRNGTIRMRLHPAELGSLRLEISVRDGVMTARMETETQTARNLLLDNLPALRERLAQQDIKVQQFDIDLMDNSTGGSPRGPEDESFSGEDRSGRQGSGTAAEQAAEPEEASVPRLVTRPGEGIHLNVVI